MDVCVTCERGILLSSTATDITIVFEKSNIAWWKYISTGTSVGPGEKHQHLCTRLHKQKKPMARCPLACLVLPRRCVAYDGGSVTERLLYIPVPASLCMQD